MYLHCMFLNHTFIIIDIIIIKNMCRNLNLVQALQLFTASALSLSVLFSAATLILIPSRKIQQLSLQGTFSTKQNFTLFTIC